MFVLEDSSGLLPARSCAVATATHVTSASAGQSPSAPSGRSPWSTPKRPPSVHDCGQSNLPPGTELT